MARGKKSAANLPIRYYSKRTRNRLRRILKDHERIASTKPVIANVLTNKGNAGNFDNNPFEYASQKPDSLPVSLTILGSMPSIKTGYRANIAGYKQSSQPVKPMNTGKVARKSRETLKLVSRKAK